MVTNAVRMTMVVMMLATLLTASLSACGKKADTPVKTNEQVKAEQDAATKATRENAVYGEQLKALDKAKATAAATEDAAKKTEDALKKAEEGK